MARTSHRPLIARRVAVGALAASLALVAVPAVAAPAQAATTSLTSEEFASRYVAAANATKSGLLAVGGTATEELTGFAAPYTSLVVDPARRTARATDPFDLTDFAEIEGRLPMLLGDPCKPGFFGDLSPQTVLAEGVGRYTPITKDSPDYLRKGRKLVGEPKARWYLAKSKRASLSRFVASQDLFFGRAAAIAGPTTNPYYVFSGATEEPLDGGGKRYAADYTSEVTDQTGRFVVDTSADGRAVSVTEIETLAGRTYSSITRYAFGARSVKVPKKSTVITSSKARPGCTALFVEDVVDVLPKQVAKRLNKDATKKKPVTVNKLRRAVSRELRMYDRLNVRDNDVPGGVEIVGNARLLDGPVTKQVVVVNGKAVVRTGNA
jgi:hypothetical protein